jgi:hypothetical protein
VLKDSGITRFGQKARRLIPVQLTPAARSFPTRIQDLVHCGLVDDLGEFREGSIRTRRKKIQRALGGAQQLQASLLRRCPLGDQQPTLL